MGLDSAAATLVIATVIAGSATAANYVSIPLEASVNRPADAVWKRIGGYCDIGAWLKTTCVITAGKDGETGAMRRIADRIDEVLVATTEHSYTYAQPKSPIDYHGTVEVRADGPGHCRILYTLVYDAEPLGAAQVRAADKARRTAQFTAILATMKAIAQAD